MEMKSLFSRIFLVVCTMCAATIFMGMVKEKSLAQQFLEIRNHLPAQAAGNPQIYNTLNTVRIALEQSQPDLALASKILETMQGPIKSMNFATDFGTLNGQELINVYFGDFINQLNKKSAQQPTAPSIKKEAPVEKIEKPSQSALAQEFAQILENLPKTGENIPLLRQPLMAVQNLLLQPKPNLSEVLQALQKIKQNNAIKNAKFNTPMLADVTGEQLFSIYFDDFIKKISLQLQADQPRKAGIPFGLVNKNQTCFMNSSIQALASLDKVTNVLLKHAYDDYYLPNSISALYIQLLNTMQTEKKSVINPLPFCLQGWKLFPGQEGRQQDAAEFVELLLGRLTESNDINPARSPAKINQELLSLLEVKILELTYEKIGEKYIRTKDKAFNPPLITPALAIKPEYKSLLDCLKGTFNPSNPEGETKNIIRAIDGTSNYFICSIGRLVIDYVTKKYIKINQPISFELDNFNISSLTLRPSKVLPLYRCKAFIAHSGAEVGHYIAYIRMGNNWYMCDDTNIIPVSTSEVNKFAQTGIFKAVVDYTPVMFFYEQQ